MTRRFAFRLQVREGLVDDYVARHSPIWPDMVAELAASGRRNYSIFLAPGGTLFGYYETDDDEAARAYLASSDVATRWEASMADFFVDLDGRADQAATPLVEVFNLDMQLDSSHTANGTRS